MTIRNYGYQNPEAVMYGKAPITVDDVLASRMVASPFHLLDCCIAAEGGAAVVLTTLPRARDLPRAPIEILAAPACRCTALCLRESECLSRHPAAGRGRRAPRLLHGRH